MVEETQNVDLTGMISHIVAVYVSNHDMDAEDLPRLIQLTAQSLRSLSRKEGGDLRRLYAPGVPAVSIEDSLQPDYLVCLEDGRRMKMLKRHLRTAYNMTPEQYRVRWNLPLDYPMVAPNYAKKRSDIAKDVGLGTRSSGRPRKAAA